MFLFKKKLLKIFALLFISAGMLLYTYGIPFLVKNYLGQILQKQYGLHFEIKEVKMIGIGSLECEGVAVSAPHETGKIDFQAKNLEVIFGLWSWLTQSKKLVKNIKMEGVVLESENYLRLNLSNIVIDQVVNDQFKINFSGDYEGEFDLQLKNNLSWQVNYSQLVADGLRVIRLNGVLKHRESKGYAKIDIESLGAIAAVQLSFEGFRVPDVFSMLHDKISGNLNIKGDLNNLKRFLGDPLALHRDLSGSFDLWDSSKDRKESYLQGSYEFNEFVAKWYSGYDEENQVEGELLVDDRNNIMSVGSIALKATDRIKKKLSFFKDLSGGIKININASGKVLDPIIQVKIDDDNLVYHQTKLSIKGSLDYRNKVLDFPFIEVSSPKKKFLISFKLIQSLEEQFKLIVNKLELGDKENLFKLEKQSTLVLDKEYVLLDTLDLENGISKIGFSFQQIKGSDALGSISIKKLELNEVYKLFNLHSDLNLQGLVTSTFKLSGNLNDPKVSAVGLLEKIKFGDVRGGDCTFSVLGDSSEIEIEKFEWVDKTEESYFSLDGKIPIHFNLSEFVLKEDVARERFLNLVCRNTSTSWIKGVVPNVESLEGRITGKLSAYKFEEKRYFLGDLELSDGRLALALNLAPMTEIQAKINFNREKINLKGGKVKMGQGVLTMDGYLGLEDLNITHMNFVVKAQQVKIINDEDLVIILGADLVYNGPIDSPLLKGKLNIDLVRYDDNLENLSERIKKFQKPRKEHSFWPKTALDIEMKCDHNVINSIKQSSYYLQGSASVHLGGFVANPNLDGRLIVEKGRIPVYSKEFVIDGGYVDLVETKPPYVSLSASYRGNDLDVKFKLEQYLDEPVEYIYSSLPSYTDEEIQRYLIFNLLPNQEGEGIDFISFLKTSIDYTDILSSENLQWLKKFSFETRTINKEGNEEVGVTVEYVFDRPEWFSVKAVQDDNGEFNFFAVASKSFIGLYVDPHLFLPEDFKNLEPKELDQIMSLIERFKDFYLPVRESNEFDVRYLLRCLNIMLSDEFLVKRIPDDLLKKLTEADLAYIAQKDQLLANDRIKDRAKAVHKYNRKLLDILFKEYMGASKIEKSSKQKEHFNENKISASDLSRAQKKSLQQLVVDELKAYVESNDISYVTLAAKKMVRICQSWGYKDVYVKVDKIADKFIDDKKQISAIKFIIETGQRYRFKSLKFMGIDDAEVLEVLKFIKFEAYKISAPVFYSESYVDFLNDRVTDYFIRHGYMDVLVQSKIENISEKEKDVHISFSVEKNKLHKVKFIRVFGNKVIETETLFRNLEKSLSKEYGAEVKSIEGMPYNSLLLTNAKKLMMQQYSNSGYRNIEVKTRDKSDFEFLKVEEVSESVSLESLKEFFIENKFGKNLLQIFGENEKLLTHEAYYHYFNQLISNSFQRWKFIQFFNKKDVWDDADIDELFETVKRDRTDKEEQLLVREILFKALGLPKYREQAIINNEFVMHGVVCLVDEGEKFKFGKITYGPKFREKLKTRKKVIERNIVIKENEVYSVSKIQESIRKLSRLGVFQEIDHVERVTGDVVDIEFVLRENKSLELEVEAGYGDIEGLQAGFRIYDHNIFGSARSLGLRSRFSDRSMLFEPVFNSPFWWGFRNQWLGFYERTEDNDFTTERVGLETSLNRSLGYGYQLGFGYKLEITDAKDVVSELKDIQADKAVFSGALFSLSMNKLDSLLLPHNGTFAKIKAETNFKAFGSTFDFFKTEFQLTQHFPLSPRVTISLGARTGLMKSFGGAAEIPLQVKFFNGGGTSVRGYSYNSIGPVVGGKNIGGEVRAIFNSEFRFPLTIRTKKQYAVFFYDAGFLEEDLDEMDDIDWYTSMGVGYRYLSPIGPIRLDLGFNLHDRVEDKSLIDLEHDGVEIKNLYFDGHKARLHLSFGYAF